MSSNLKVNNILPSTGDTVAVSGIASVTSSVSIASSCTATTFYGSGANLTSLPSQVTINNATADRVLTSNGGTTLNAESALTFDGNTLTVSAPSNDTPLIVDTASTNGAHLRFQKDGSNQHFVGAGGGISLGDREDLSLRAYDNILFATGNSSTEKLRIDDSGNLFLRGGSANWIVMGSSGDPTSGGVNNNMNWIRGNQTNTQYNTAGGFHGFEVSGSEKFRIDNTGHATISDGDLVIGTSGHGIDFSNTGGSASGSSSALLDDYEEGSFTPSLSNTGTISYSHQIGRYTKVGRQVHFIAFVRWNSRSNNGNYNITYSGLPFTSINVSNMSTPIYVGGSEGFSCNYSDRTHIGGSVHVNNTGGQFRVSNTMGGSEVSFHGQYGSTGAGYIYWGGSYYAS